jgi:hypothetical protein
MAESLELYPGLIFNYPKEPAKYKIAGHTLVKKSQKWERVETPENFDELTEKEQYDHAVLINKYCAEGYWFYNNGDPTYITGDHFHYLNEFKLDIGYPEYRDVDRRWFYAWHICETDDNSIGMDYAKKRRDGFSYRAASIILNNARKTSNSHYGIISKTGIDAQECFSKVVYAFKEYNSFLKPQVHSAEDVKKELYFQTPIQKITHKTRKIEKEISLNTKISWKNTKDNSYDGFKLKRILIDEAGKMEEANFNKLFNIIKTTLLVGGRLIGKALIGSTVNESNKGGKAFKEIWDLSDPLEKNENERTTTGLYRYFVPAYDGLEGFVDEYGQSVIEDPTEKVYDKDGVIIKQGAKSYLTKERNGKRKAGDIVGFYEQMRQFPFDESEMFRDAANEKTTFDLDRIYEQLDHNQVSVAMNRVLVRGNFEWKDGVRDTSVEWKPSENGRWLICWLPEPEERNKQKLVYGQRSPLNTHIGCFGLDPYSSKSTTSGKHSLAASHGFRKYDLLNESKSNCFISEYWARPKDPLIVYEDMIKACVFYGWQILVESNKTNCLDYFRLRGYEKYLMERPAITHTESSKAQKEPGLPNAGEGLRQQLIETYENYISNYVGINQENGKIGFMPFDNTLHDAINFDSDKWNDFDLTCSAMITLIGSKRYVEQKREVQKFNLFQKYKVVGNTSRKA